MKIKVITIHIEHDRDINPSVNLIGPDSDLKDCKILNEGIVPDMVMLDYMYTTNSIKISE